MADFKSYPVSGFTNQKVDIGRLTQEINNSSISVALNSIVEFNGICSVYFKADLLSEDIDILDSIIAVHLGEPLEKIIPPRTFDNKEIIRSDSRPLGTSTYFTCAGDDTEIGNGKDVFWDFSNDDDISSAPEGYKRKTIDFSFAEDIFIKEGSFYFFDTLKGSYGQMAVMCPAGHYYYNRDGSLNQATEDIPIIKFVNKHFFAGSCPMGDELNAEGAQESPLPPNYFIRLEITVPESDIISFGWVSLEIYRARTILLPGESL